MAADYYLQLDGIKGESVDSKHVGWIEYATINWSIHQPKSATASTGGGHTAERAARATSPVDTQAASRPPTRPRGATFAETPPFPPGTCVHSCFPRFR